MTTALLQVISEGGEVYHGEIILMKQSLRSVTNLLKIKRGKQKKAWLCENPELVMSSLEKQRRGYQG